MVLTKNREMIKFILSLFFFLPLSISGGTISSWELPGTITINSPIVIKIPTIDMVAMAVMHKESLGGLIIETEASKIEGSVGPMQIQKGMVDYINRICKTHFTYRDRLDYDKSLEMFKCFQRIHNPEQNIDLAAHIWNAGQNRVKERWGLTTQYRSDVRKFLKDKYGI